MPDPDLDRRWLTRELARRRFSARKKSRVLAALVKLVAEWKAYIDCDNLEAERLAERLRLEFHVDDPESDAADLGDNP